MRSVARLLSRAGFRCDAISSDRRLASAGVVQRWVPLEPAPRWIEAALEWQARTGGMVVPCDDALIREARDAAIDGAAKCRLLPITGLEQRGSHRQSGQGQNRNLLHRECSDGIGRIQLSIRDRLDIVNVNALLALR